MPIAALMELYGEWEAQRKPKKQSSQVTLQPEPEEVPLGYLDKDSDWHYVIENRNWDALLDLLQNYDFDRFKEERQKPTKKSRKLRVVGAVKLVASKVITAQKEPEGPKPISPLLALNEAGQTPLHVAIRLHAPDRLVLRMLFAERRAALVADQSGQTPLHLSCICERNQQVIDRMIRANFQHMQQHDVNGKTPLWYAVERAKEEQDTDKVALVRVVDTSSFGYWGIPRNSSDVSWQTKQEVYWGKVRFILLCYSTRRKVLLESERDILLDALEHAAPPSVVEVCILAGQHILNHDPTLASSALKLFMRRDYPIKNLQLLLHHFPVQKVESLEAARRLLSDHYHAGCRTLPGRDLAFRAEMERSALTAGYEPTLACQEWWNKIMCLLRLCGHGNDHENRKHFEDKYLLHAALSNQDTPPSLVQLLMVLWPASYKLPHPFNGALIVHLICRNWKYNLFPQSKNIGVALEMEEPPMEQVLKIILASDPSLVRKRFERRLPIHYALATSKSVQFLQALTRWDPSTLGVRDPETKLYPFQCAALSSQNKNAALWAHAQYTDLEWKDSTPEERAIAVTEVCQQQELEQLNTLLFVLKQFPSAIASGAAFRKPAVFRDSQGKGMISAHYLDWFYERSASEISTVPLQSQNKSGSKMNYATITVATPSSSVDVVWRIRGDRMALFYEATRTREIPSEMQSWWSKLHFWIWYCFDDKDNLDIPHRSDEYLLHAALANSDTPPKVIELLLALQPKAASVPINGGDIYPLHIAAATASYKPQIYEWENGGEGHHDHSEVSSCTSMSYPYDHGNVLRMVLEAFPDAASISSTFMGGVPLEIGARSGKTEHELAPLLEQRGRYFDDNLME